MLSKNDLRMVRCLLRANVAHMPDRRGRMNLLRTKLTTLEYILTDYSFLAVRQTDISEILGIERRHFSRQFRRIFGQSYGSWIRGVRIRRAKWMLQTTYLRISQIAVGVGYSDITTFERNFRRCVSMSPKQWRKLRFEALHNSEGINVEAVQ
jgi:AraC-like DNA-binding protein